MPKGRNIGFNSSGGFGIRCALESQFWGTKCWKWWETITFWGRNCHCHCYGECLKHIWTYICISLSLSLCKNTYIYIHTHIYIYTHIMTLFTLVHIISTIPESCWRFNPAPEAPPEVALMVDSWSEPWWQRHNKRNRWLLWTGRGPFCGCSFWLFNSMINASIHYPQYM